MITAHPSKNIYTIDSQEGFVSPVATLDLLSWLEGHWRGEALDGIGEEIWGPAFGPSMMGVFKLMVADHVKFYEILTISEFNNSLIMRIKHFGPDLKGWEATDESIDFVLLKITESKIYFDGLTFEHVSENEIRAYVLLSGEGNSKVVVFNYHRVR